ncbi:amino acid adenylation domain-containing protein [Corallococcus macrosporus]|uniref:Amino acid adenylation domain-containing protein n=1 Tax=Corallococcus macrosporus TaxID=35 RepID=A0ABS3DIY0_9BACT|nr:non-ribosomal peptide synthetase [Corallococcus macrosporus]MBN8231300.1 amino acid adenylation domain-containing protein [Corallococcus macrosporus]
MTTEHPGSPSASAPKSRRRAPPVVPVSRDALLPLSFGQQRMWFIEQLTPGGISYNVPYFARLTGALDVPALERALAVLVERHEALRTTFAVVDGQPVQRIAPSLSLPLRVESLEALPASEREQALRRTAEAEARTPFDLGAGPLVRVRLLRLGETEHVLLLMLHHICCDGWSLTVMERELQALYAAFRTGTTPALPALPVQYADHAVWQRQWLRGEHLTQQLEWWRGALTGAPPALELPTDRPRPSAQSTRGAVHRHALPPELGKALEVLCRRQGVTLFMALLGGMHLLLSRLSGQDDIVIGSPISGRTRQEVEPLIGFFINTLPLRVQGEGSLGFGELLRRVRKTCLDAYAHQEVPFEQLVDALQPERDLSRPPLFQVLFTLQHSAVPALELEGLKTSELDFEPGVSRMDLTVFLRETPEGLVSLWEYSTDLFDAATVARFAEHYTRLLEAAVAEPERPVATLPMLSEAERQRLLELGTGAAVPYPREASLPALFAEQAARTPDAVALEAGSQKLTYAEQAARTPDAIAPEAGGQRLTYAELEARANQLAHHLRGQGVSLGTPVGLCASRSLEMVVATLAILKAGGAYVPLDPSYPSERLEFMARDARISVLLVEPGRESALESLASRVVVLDPSWRTFAGHPESAPDVHIPADALAYVMYTSGSTGRPKGVGVPHRAVTRLVKGVSYVRFDAQDVVLQLATTSFDAATLELWGALLNGAKLFLYPPVTPSLEELEATLEREHISVLFLTTAFFEQMALNRPASLARVKQVITGGDVLSPLAARKLLDAGRAVVNGYGPTENTTFSATYQVKRDLDARMPVPIGRPLENSQALVLDARLEPVPPGVVGDLYVGGDGLAWGYLDRPELTADRFVPHPFSETPGARLYRTGDRARWLPSGELAFMGRADSQVKLRGFRIELGEIETALRHLPGVEDAVAEVREYAPGDKRLVAWVAGPTVDMSALRPSLAARLPAPLVPSAFVKLDRLPLTPVGKVDRKALVTPMGDAPTGESSVAPVTPTETAVAEVWAALLGRTRVGAQDSFFELGGHSLLATQVVSRLRETFAVDLSVRALFEAPTVTSLAARIDALRLGSHRLQALPLVPGPRDGWQPQSFAQQRLWIISQLDPLGYAYNVPLVTRLRGALDTDALERSLAEIIRRHDVLRTTFNEVDGQPVQRIGPAGDFTLQRVDVAAAQLAERLSTEARRPFDLRRGPLMRGLLLRVADDDQVLMLVIHHIVFDGWSVDVLQRELNALYPSKGQGTLLPLSLQYVDYARWQRESFHAEELEDQLTWWREALRGAPPVLELPTDKPRPSMQTFQGANFEVRLPQSLHGALQSLGQREGATLFMTLLAGFQALLARYSGQEDLVVGSPISGRNRREVEGLIGFFVNTLALRADVSGTRSFRQLLRGVRESCLGAFAHQDLPFEQLVDALKPPRDLSRTPLVQAMFVLQRAATPLSLPGLAVEDFPFQAGISRFDLMLFMRQTPHGLVAYWEYNTALFEEATLARMAAHHVRLLEGVTANPDLALVDVPLLSPEEREQLLVAWNHREEQLPARERIHVRVEAQAERTPDAVALTNAAESLTYAQLDARANQLAHHLIALGVTPGSSVGLCLERSSLDMPIAVLATLKAGAACVPLDPNAPAESWVPVLEDTRAPVVLAHERFVRALPPDTSARIVTLEAASVARHPASSPDVRLSPEAVCYVVFTSAGADRPRGIAMSHRGLGNVLAWRTRHAVRARATTLQLAPPGSDTFFQELFSTWCAGGRLVISDEEARRDPRSLLRFLTRHPIERLFLPSVELQSLSEAAHAAPGLPPLHEVITSGEPLQVTPALVSFFERLPGCVLESQYGPPETHAACAWRAAGAPSTWPARPPLGRPLPSVQLYVLDPRQQPCPVGVPGELYVGGEGLAHGLPGWPGLTAERFVPAPFSTTPGARLYRTGDKGRWLADGQLERLGRMDGQVRLRGLRIALGEVESALRALPDVRDAAVVVREDTPGRKQLVAYVVQPEAAFSQRVLRQALARRLPEHGVPAVLVRMDALPLGPSGRVDRNALPAPVEETADDTGSRAPMTAVEKVIADIWASLLVVPQVSLQAHFFELGGHSLLATQVVSRLREAFGVDLSLRVLFEAPTLAELAARVEALRQQAHPLRTPPLMRLEGGDSAPQSFPQQRLWFIDALAPGGFAFNVPLFVRCKGPLDVAALERSLVALIDRHESLRTVFAQEDGQPVQRVLPSVPFALVHEPREDVPPHERDTVLRQHAEARMRHVFDLRSGPLLTATLVRLDAEDHALLLLMHHIITDGWSTEVMGRELGILYDAFTRNQTPRLPPLPIRYTDYARWQRATLRGEGLDAQVAWWKQHLEGAPPALELPTDRPRPPVQAQTGAAHVVRLPAAVDAAVKELCHQQGVTPFMALLAGFQALLSRYSGQDDLVVGSPISGRNHRELEGLIGFFVNALPLRVKVSGARSFQGLLHQVRETCLGAYAHQEVPFEQLVDALQTPRDLSRTPVFQAVFALFQDFPGIPLRGLETAPVSFDPGLAKHDLTLFVRESASGTLTHWEYNTALFDAATVERMAGHYVRLLEQLTRTPERPLASLSLLTEAERRQLLVAWNDTALEVPADVRVLPCITRQARQRPDALALASDGQRLTFQELETGANRLAHLLRAHGVGPETVVALCMDRTPGYVCGALGILKAGAAYLPMDLKWPEAWWRHVLTDSDARVVVTRQAFASRFEDRGVRVLCLDAEPALEAQPTTAPGVTPHDEAMAYVIYTSGSTGKPKGVAVTHGTLANLVAGLGTVAAIAPGDRATLLTGLAFDATVFETWPALSHGASLHLPSDEVRAEPARLVRWLASEGITLTTLPTPMAEAALEQPWPAGMPLRRVHVAGDVLHRRPGPSVPGRWFNCYGPTENTVIATSGVVTPEVPQGPLPPIGTPEPNVRVYVLDGAGQPVPVGLWGELFLGGAQVARGYLGQPALTAERFGPDPFSPEPGARLYRTGDVARWLADGTLEFRGRADSQVKLRGFRIELGEVEAALLAQPRVKEAVAQVREDVPGQRRLVAYVVLHEGTAFTVDALRASLRGALAEHAVPSAFVVLERLPLTANGKLDRKALPAPDAHRPELSEDYRVPEAGLEETLAALWAGVLGLERVGASDNFFDLGGNSLLLQAVHAKLEARVGRKVPLLTLFQYPTVRALAGHLSPPGDPPPGAKPTPTQDAGAQRRDNLRRMAQRRGR